LNKHWVATYCDNVCQKEYQWWERKSNIEKKQRIVPPLRKVARRYLLEKYGVTCSICGLRDTWQEKELPLILDHIDGKWDNWNLDNVRMVCPNCNAQLSTYNGRNIGNASPNRKDNA